MSRNIPQSEYDLDGDPTVIPPPKFVPFESKIKSQNLDDKINMKKNQLSQKASNQLNRPEIKNTPQTKPDATPKLSNPIKMDINMNLKSSLEANSMRDINPPKIHSNTNSNPVSLRTMSQTNFKRERNYQIFN